MSDSRALLTDLYELTMACGYRRAGIGGREAVFHLFFREHPFGGGFALAAGLEAVVEHLTGLRFDADDRAYLAGLASRSGTPLFEPAFLEHLGALRFECDIDAVPEGTVVFAGEPVLRVRGPLEQCQLAETALLTLTNFATLVATKAARVCYAAAGDPVLEFGLRRAQGPDGGLTASRAAYVGGCEATSNVLAGKRFGIPVRGTHAHSWVMCFEREQEAFDAYADAFPDETVLLVDTYDTLEGVRHAARTGRRLREAGHALLGVRLDSGDFARLSIEARRILDEAGLADARIVASGDLDEHAIARLKRQGARIDIWGVGTRLATAWDQPALGGVYKLSAWRDAGGEWSRRLKLSDDPAKGSDPGILQVRRTPEGDWIHDVGLGCDEEGEDLLVPVLRGGRPVADLPDAAAIRARARRQLERLDPAVRRLEDPDQYPVRREARLAALRETLRREVRP